MPETNRGSARWGPPLVLLTVLGIVLTLIPFGAELNWLAELISHFRLQYAVAGGIVLVVSLALRQLACAAALAACVAVNVWPVLPYLVTRQPTGPAADAISVLSANVRAATADPGRLLELVAASRPDVLLVVEDTSAFDDALDVLAADFPHRLTAPSDGPFGIALYSRLPIPDARVFRLGKSAAVRATIDTGHGVVEFIGVHLLPPVSSVWARERNRQIDALATLVADRSERTAICGDYNLSPYSPYFAQLLRKSGLHDPRRGRGIARTWPVAYPPLGIAIDHCLLGADLRAQAIRTLGDIGSDHYPVLISIVPGGAR